MGASQQRAAALAQRSAADEAAELEPSSAAVSAALGVLSRGGTSSGEPFPNVQCICTCTAFVCSTFLKTCRVHSTMSRACGSCVRADAEILLHFWHKATL